MPLFAPFFLLLIFSFYIYPQLFVRFDTHVQIYKMHKICMDLSCKRCDTVSFDRMLNIACNSMICYILVHNMDVIQWYNVWEQPTERGYFFFTQQKKNDILAIKYAHTQASVGKAFESTHSISRTRAHTHIHTTSQLFVFCISSFHLFRTSNVTFCCLIAIFFFFLVFSPTIACIGSTVCVCDGVACMCIEFSRVFHLFAGFYSYIASFPFNFSVLFFCCGKKKEIQKRIILRRHFNYAVHMFIIIRWIEDPSQPSFLCIHFHQLQIESKCLWLYWYADVYV